MRPRSTLLAAAVLLVTAGAAAAQKSQPIRLEHDSAAERQTLQHLQRLLGEYDVTRWKFAPEVLIDEETGIPHSHPVLTLGTRDRSDADLLSTYVHENLHWYISAHEGTGGAIADFEEMFPDAPGPDAGGARDPHSSRLHLIVCRLEYEAMAELIGEPQARELLAGMQHYQWVYDKVLNDPRIPEVLAKNGILAP